MAKTAYEGFEGLLRSITPTIAQREAATSHRSSVLSKLQNSFDIYRMFETGSFKHGTGVAGWSDLDYLVSLKSDRPVLSSSILTSFRNRLQERFPNTTVRVSRPAVVIHFGGGYETFEVIPAYALSSVGDSMMFNIPGVTSEWMLSTPESHLKYVTDCNKTPVLGKAKSFARIIKAWKYFCNVPVSSFYLEMRAAIYIARQSQVAYSIDLYYFLKELYDIQLASMNDPTGGTGRINAYSSESNKIDAISKLGTAMIRAEKAMEAQQKGDLSTAFYYWNLIFNGNFPGYY